MPYSKYNLLNIGVKMWIGAMTMSALNILTLVDKTDKF